MAIFFFSFFLTRRWQLLVISTVFFFCGGETRRVRGFNENVDFPYDQNAYQPPVWWVPIKIKCALYYIVIVLQKSIYNVQN